MDKAENNNRTNKQPERGAGHDVDRNHTDRTKHVHAGPKANHDEGQSGVNKNPDEDDSDDADQYAHVVTPFCLHI